MTLIVKEDDLDKWFNTRCGRKLKYIDYDKYYNYFYYPETTQILNFYKSGRYYNDGEHELDIVAEWCEPIEREMIIYLWKDGSTAMYDARDEPTLFVDELLASTKVKLKEGEFADD